MRIYQPFSKVSLSFAVLLAGMFSSCEQDITSPVEIVDEDAPTKARAIYTSRSVNWSNRSDGTYTSAEASEDFGNMSGWNDSRAYNSGGTCRVLLLKDALSGAGGMIANIDIADGSEYELQFDVKYHSQFDWSRGGKVGFGFRIGEGNTGCDRADDGNGGSARVMWYQSDAGRVYLKPYIYYKDMPGTCGHDFGKSYPATGSIQKGQWYTVKIYVKSNTGSNTDGQLKMFINGTTVLSTPIRWTTNDAQRLINRMAFHTFRGGSDTYWQSSTDGYIYYDNLTWTRISS